MKIIILEGIATSGKTSVKKKLAKLLLAQEKTFSIFDEKETLMPILQNTDRQTSLDFLKKVIGEALKTEKDFLIFDRLFFAHIFKTKSSIADFREIENMVEENCLLAFLEIAEPQIPERIETARRLREKSWNEYVSKKGSDAEIHQYYLNQQRTLLARLPQTSLNYKLYDTTDMDFEKIAKNILSEFI
jgi:cytidylate kinase